MNNRDVKSVFVKLIAGLLLAFVLVGVTVPVAFAEEETTPEQTTEEQTAAPEADMPAATLDDDTIEDIAGLLASNDSARQLFLAACAKNAVGKHLKYKESYLNDKGDFAFDSTLSIEEGFVEMADWSEASAYALQILRDAEEISKKDVTIPEKLTVEDAEEIIREMQTEVDLENNGNFLDAILRAIGFALNWATKYLTFGTNNYILSLLYFGLIIEILMLPFAISQQKNSIKQAKLRPKEMAIRNRYKGRNDQATLQKVNQEIQELYQKENFNPMSGCLPLLLQLPIVMALYYVVIDPAFYVLGQAKAFSSAITQYFTTSVAAGGFGGTLSSNRGTIEILSKLGEQGIDAFESLKSFSYFSNAESCFDALEEIVTTGIPSFNIGSWNMGLTPWSAVTGGGEFFAGHWWLLLVPVLTFVVYFGSMKINRKLTYQPTTAENDKATGCSNSMMDFMMPLMSVYIAFIVPAAVGIYWMFKSVLGTVKQLIMKKAMPIPVFTEADYKAAEKERYGKNPKPVKSSGSGTRNPDVRSLHHIDDDEYDAKGNYIGRPATSEDEEEQPETKNKNKKAPAMAEPLKDESDKQEKTDASDDTNS
ncbi:MAG: YidC/Oxa1 family membrane protein insertase [Clostridia bacterium]|nr:YidC/Oxa1 family membrane protein insertase [Clostridia bacterium]